MTLIPSLTFTDYEWFPWSICNGCSMPAGNAYPSGHLVPSPFWDLLMLQLLRPNSSNLPYLYSTFHLEYPLLLSRFCLQYIYNHNQFYTLYCKGLGTPHALPVTVLQEFRTQVIICLDGQAVCQVVRIEIKESLVRSPAETYILILNLSLVFLPYTSAEPLQMKSSMSYRFTCSCLDPRYD